VRVSREFKQIATAGAATATGSNSVQKRVIAHVSCSHPAVAGNPCMPVGRFQSSLWYMDFSCFFRLFIQRLVS